MALIGRTHHIHPGHMHPFVHSIFDGRGAWSLHCYHTAASLTSLQVKQKECAQILEATTASPLWCLCSQMPSKEEDAAVSSYCATHLVPKLHNILVPVFFCTCHLLLLSLLGNFGILLHLCDFTEEVIDGATSCSKDLTCSIPVWEASI